MKFNQKYFRRYFWTVRKAFPPLLPHWLMAQDQSHLAWASDLAHFTAPSVMDDTHFVVSIVSHKGSPSSVVVFTRTQHTLQLRRHTTVGLPHEDPTLLTARHMKPVAEAEQAVL